MPRLARLGWLAALSVPLVASLVAGGVGSGANGASCLTAPASSAVGDTALLTWTCGGTSPDDWIGLYPSSATPNTGEVLWRYTGGNAAGGKIGIVVPLDTPTGGSYE